MAKWHGKVGYVTNVETEPGIWSAVATEKLYSGDILSNRIQNVNSNKVNDDFTVANKISIIADPFANKNFEFIKYVEFMGSMWEVSSAEVQFPRIILAIGGIYNGEQAGIVE